MLALIMVAKPADSTCPTVRARISVSPGRAINRRKIIAPAIASSVLPPAMISAAAGREDQGVGREGTKRDRGPHPKPELQQQGHRQARGRPDRRDRFGGGGEVKAKLCGEKIAECAGP